MNVNRLEKHIEENFDINNAKLIRNILEYVSCQGLVGSNESVALLLCLLDGLGLEESDIELFL